MKKAAMNWYNYEGGETVYGLSKCEALREYLYKHEIEHEVSGCGSGYHFEIYTTAAGARRINAFLDWYDDQHGIAVIH